MTPDWVLYYRDLSVFSSEDGSWEDAPAEGVVVMFVNDREPGRPYERWVQSAPQYRFFMFLPGDKYPIGVQELGSSVCRLGIPDAPRPFPEDDPWDWLREKGVLQHFKFSPFDCDKEMFSDVLRFAKQNALIPPGNSPHRREGDR